jgi:hypothetical protein
MIIRKREMDLPKEGKRERGRDTYFEVKGFVDISMRRK